METTVSKHDLHNLESKLVALEAAQLHVPPLNTVVDGGHTSTSPAWTTVAASCSGEL